MKTKVLLIPAILLIGIAACKKCYECVYTFETITEFPTEWGIPNDTTVSTDVDEICENRFAVKASVKAAEDRGAVCTE